jgi:hypothetical protein
MAMCEWKLPASGQSAALDALVVGGLRVEPASGGQGRGEVWFEARRGRVSLPFVVRDGGEVAAFYRPTWPWRWRAEARLFFEVCRSFDGCCERVV